MDKMYCFLRGLEEPLPGVVEKRNMGRDELTVTTRARRRAETRIFYWRPNSLCVDRHVGVEGGQLSGQTTRREHPFLSEARRSRLCILEFAAADSTSTVRRRTRSTTGVTIARRFGRGGGSKC